jgi:hypothetical protein
MLALPGALRSQTQCYNNQTTTNFNQSAKVTHLIWPLLLMLSPMLALPGSLIQWIFWFFTGARLRASHENSQSLHRRMAEEKSAK